MPYDIGITHLTSLLDHHHIESPGRHINTRQKHSSTQHASEQEQTSAEQKLKHKGSGSPEQQVCRTTIPFASAILAQSTHQ